MQTEEGRARTGCPNEQGTEVRSRMQARRLLPRRSIPPASPSCPQSPFVRITPFGWGGSGCLLERLRERRRSWPAQARRHICDRISACEQGFRALDSACFGVSPDALPRLARERRAQVRTAHEQHARKLVQAGRAPLVEHSLDGCAPQGQVRTAHAPKHRNVRHRRRRTMRPARPPSARRAPG